MKHRARKKWVVMWLIGWSVFSLSLGFGRAGGYLLGRHLDSEKITVIFD